MVSYLSLCFPNFNLVKAFARNQNSSLIKMSNVIGVPRRTKLLLRVKNCPICESCSLKVRLDFSLLVSPDLLPSLLLVFRLL